MTKFSDLPKPMQEAVCYNIHGLELDELSEIGRANLDVLTPWELFDCWLCYEGIIGYTQTILNTHELIFKGEN